MSRMKTRCKFCLLGEDFMLTNFFRVILFRSELRNWLFRKPGNATEHFLLRNNGNHSESIPRIFFRTKFCCQTYSTMNSVYSSFSHDLSPPFLFPHFSVLISFSSSLSLFALLLSLSPYPFLLSFPSSLTHLWSSLNLLLLPFIYPLIPHSSFITILLIPCSSSHIHHPLPLSLSLFGCITQKRGWGKNWLVGQIRIWNLERIFQKQQNIGQIFKQFGYLLFYYRKTYTLISN